MFGSFELASGFTKLALGIRHFVPGEAWSSSTDADKLRKVINEKDPAKWRDVKLHGTVWPDGDDPLAKLLAIDNDHHVLAIINTLVLGFHRLLFGGHYAFLHLATKVWIRTKFAPGKGVVFNVDCRQRKWTTHDYETHIASQTMKHSKVDLVDF